MRSKQIIFFILLHIPAMAIAKDVLHLGYLEYPPLVYTTHESIPKGPIITFLEQNLIQDFDIIWSKIPVGRVRWSFENKVIDAYPFFIRTPEREAWAYYFNKPYMTFQSMICSRKDHEKPVEMFESPSEDMIDSILVYPLNAKYKFPFLNDSRISQINIEYTNYINRSLALLEKKRADYVFFPSSAGLELDKNNPDLACMDVGEKQGLYFTLSKNNPLKNKIEKIFETIETLQF